VAVLPQISGDDSSRSHCPMRCIASSSMRPPWRGLNQVGTLRGTCLAGDADGDRCPETFLRARLAKTSPEFS